MSTRLNTRGLSLLSNVLFENFMAGTVRFFLIPLGHILGQLRAGNMHFTCYTTAFISYPLKIED